MPAMLDIIEASILCRISLNVYQRGGIWVIEGYETQECSATVDGTARNPPSSFACLNTFAPKMPCAVQGEGLRSRGYNQEGWPTTPSSVGQR